MKYFYIGSFPPPYGGVTIKNKLLFKQLSQYIEVHHSGFYDKNRSLLHRGTSLLTTLFKPNCAFIIGISRGSLQKLTHILYIVNRKAMNNSVVMVMGGTFSDIVANNKKLQNRVKEYKHIYVETSGMKTKLNEVGLFNVSVFPNCREIPDGFSEIVTHDNLLVRCLYFSLISKDKGADIVLEAAEKLQRKNINFIVDFYGQIDESYKMEFEKGIEKSKYLNYYGIFKADEESVYSKMKSYDVLLFPTRCSTEGVPGVLVESKISGITAIVSNESFNSEIVESGKNGIVLEHNNSIHLADAVEQLYSDPNYLYQMRAHAKESSEKYFIENYIREVVQMIHV